MPKVEQGELERLESELSVARIKKMRAARELTTLERQSGFVDAPRKLRTGLDRAEQRLEKCTRIEADLVNKIEAIRNPKPEGQPEAEASEAAPSEGPVSETQAAPQNADVDGTADSDDSGAQAAA